MTDTGSGENANLDFLRSVAVLAVVVFHILLVFRLSPFPLNMLGHWGVLIFFVHTSLVLMFSLQRLGGGQAATNLYQRFIIRRVFRIYPLSVLMVVAVCALRIPVGHLQDGHFVSVALSANNMLANLLLVQNLTGADSVLAPLWSLPFEMQMYLLLPFLFLIAVRSRSVSVLIAIWAATALAAVLAPPGVAAIIKYVPCFMAGIVSFKLAGRYRLQLPYYGWPLFIAGLTAIYLLHPTPAMSWIVCLALGLAIPLFLEIPHGPLRRACSLVARYSYGIYLTHFVCLWLAFGLFHTAPLWASWALFAAAMILLPVLFYHCVEAPFISVGKRLTGRDAGGLGLGLGRGAFPRLWAVAPAALAFCVCCGLSACRPEEHLSPRHLDHAYSHCGANSCQHHA